jgi:hypothetical protein
MAFESRHAQETTMPHTHSGNVVHMPNAAHRPQVVTLYSPTFARNIAALKEIAEISGANLITDGLVHRDHELIDLCAEALHLARQCEGVGHNRRNLDHEDKLWRTRWDALREVERALERLIRPMVRRAGKLRATTAAGIYAKALLTTVAPSSVVLATSLATDLIACEGLRESLTWPASGRTST